MGGVVLVVGLGDLGHELCFLPFSALITPISKGIDQVDPRCLDGRRVQSQPAKDREVFITEEIWHFEQIDCRQNESGCSPEDEEDVTWLKVQEVVQDVHGKVFFYSNNSIYYTYCQM